MKRRVERCAWLLAMFCLVGSASAQPGPAPLPWERDVPAEARRQAAELFAQAVELHEQLLRDQAATRYEEALSHWDNPHIRWNLALLMKDMGQYLRAHEHLERALAWGPEGFDAGDREKILAARQMLLQQHLAVVQARCDQPGATVALDGKPWFRGPRTARQVVLPGEHVITARLSGHFPLARNIVLPAGAQGVVTVSLSVDGIVEERRWAPWMSWAVLGHGAVAGVVGAGLDRYARGQRDQARRELARTCDGQQTCDPATPGSYRRALWGNRIGIGGMVVGSTLAATGLVLVFLNQPRAYRTEDQGAGAFEIVPLAFPDMAGVSASFEF